MGDIIVVQGLLDVANLKMEAAGKTCRKKKRLLRVKGKKVTDNIVVSVPQRISDMFMVYIPNILLLGIF